MNSPISVALRNIYHNIPTEILEITFHTDKQNVRSLDACICDKVIHGRVLPDCNIVAGQYREILLSPSWASHARVDNHAHTALPLYMYTIYTVPPEAREHRPIVHVLPPLKPQFGSLNALGGIYANYAQNSIPMSSAGSLADTALDSMTANQAMQAPIPILLDGSKIKVTPPVMSLAINVPWYLRCRVAYDNEFTNLSADAIMPLSKLILVATKAYIFKELSIKIDVGATLEGHQIGRIREIVDDYANTQEQYAELLDEFHGGAVIMDPQTEANMIYWML